MPLKPERWRKLEELYQAAQGLSPAERKHLLERADPELRSTVAAILAQEETPPEGASLLDRPAWEDHKSLLDTDTSFTAGMQVGPYRIEERIGRGGMGEVFRATDTRLGRTVAIKASLVPFSARFEREARAVAMLNHPNICTLFDVGHNYLVMELVAGPTLADRIKEGPIPLEEALTIARQIADALEAAHEKGIVHRDVKPGNVKITADGAVKVLDFGLAKVAVERPEVTADSARSLSAATQQGMVIGTPAYMSPEQARGTSVDKRADIWAFGVVLFEMLTGKRLFQGEDLAETLASVVKGRPDLSPAPPQVQRLLRKCLEKDPKRRLRDLGDVWELLEEAPSLPVIPSGKWPWTMAGLVTLVLAALAFFYFRQTPSPANTFRFTIAPPEHSSMHSFAVSPDGRLLVIAASVNGKEQLWLRPLDALQAQPMPATDDATFPFWSPDSRYIAFFAQGKLKKVAASGGPVESLCTVTNAAGGSWGRGDVIVFSPSGAGPEGMERVPASGGATSDVFKTKGMYRYPAFLPDGRHFLYTNVLSIDKSDGIYVASLDGSENRRILADVSVALFAPSAPASRAGHLIFVRDNNLMAEPFHKTNEWASGDAFPVADGVYTGAASATGFALVTASENGVLVYGPGNGAGGVTQLVLFDRTGKPPVPLGSPGMVNTPALSPDEKVVAYARQNPNYSAEYNLWLWDIARATETRFTTGGTGGLPSWSPKGDRIVFTSSRGANKGGYVMYQKASSGSGQEQLLLPPTTADISYQWSRDGRYIVYVHFDPRTKGDLWVLPVQPGQPVPASAKPIPFLQSEFEERMGQLSPDSRWMAYSSDESGQREVYVRPFPSGDGEVKISTAGGDQPRWRGDGNELFYVSASNQMTAVPVQVKPGATPRLEPGVPVPLFEVHTVTAGTLPNVLLEYDVTADGKRFVVASAVGTTASSPPLVAVVNWHAGSKK